MLSHQHEPGNVTSFSLAPHVGKPHFTVVQSGFGLHVGQHTPLAGSAAIVICVASLQASAMHAVLAHLGAHLVLQHWSGVGGTGTSPAAHVGKPHRTVVQSGLVAHLSLRCVKKNV